MTEDPNKTSRYVRSDKTNLKYGIQGYDLKAHSSRRLILYLLLVLGLLAILGGIIWRFGFK